MHRLSSLRRALQTGDAARATIREAHRLIKSNKAWTASTLDHKLAFTTAPPEAARELRDQVQELLKTVKNNNVDDAKVDVKSLPKTAAFMHEVEERCLVKGPAFTVVRPVPGINTVHEVRPQAA